MDNIYVTNKVVEGTEAYLADVFAPSVKESQPAYPYELRKGTDVINGGGLAEIANWIRVALEPMNRC